MDDLEKAILISFDESGRIDSVLKSQAVAFLQQVKETNSICSICLEKLCFSKLAQVQFWCLQCLYDSIRVKYSFMSNEEKELVRKSVFAMVCYEAVDGRDTNSVRVLDSPAFIKNKLAQVVVTLIKFEYPLIWPSVFVDLLPNLNKGTVVIDMFCRLLNVLDDELISSDYISGDDILVAVKIKDAMRAQCVPQIVKVWYDIVAMYKNSDAELCCSVLDCMSRYISWIDIGLVANDVFVQLLFELILVDGLPDQLRGAAAGVVLSVVSKRMEYKLKLMLLQNLQIKRVFGLLAGDSGSDLVSSVGLLLTGYATEVLECSMRLSLEEGQEVTVDLLNEVLPSVFYVLQNCEDHASSGILNFLLTYVGMLKRQSTLTEAQLLHVGQMLEVIRTLIRYDPAYRINLDVLDKIGKDEEDRMVEFRRKPIVLLRGIARFAPNVTEIFVRKSFDTAFSSPEEINAEEVEVALSLFYALGESYSDDSPLKPGRGGGFSEELIRLLLSTKFSCHSNRLVALVYLETIARYMKFVYENNELIPPVLSAFLDDRGTKHPNANVSQRASYLFMKVVKLYRAKLVPYIEDILQSLQDRVAQFTTGITSNELSGSEDGIHIFEAIGLLIGMEDVPLEKQTDYLSALLTPLCQQVEMTLVNAKSQNSEGSVAQIENIQQTIMAINALSKGFSERLVTASRPAIGVMFKQTLDILLQILVVFPKVEPLRSKVTSFIHRMVDTLGSSVFPYLPNTMEQLLTESEPKELVGFLVLLNQLICKFSTGIHDILEQVYPIIASRVFSILPTNDIPTAPGGLTEEIRELQELQRSFFTFLQVIVTHDLSFIFLSGRSTDHFDFMMQMLLYSSCNHKDIVVRKVCVQIFIRLIKDWCTGPHDKDEVPGFQSFIVQVFATNCCLYSVLDKSFEFRDANTVALFSEIVMAQKVMYEKFGNEFLNFVSKNLQNAYCTQELAEQYCQKLQSNDIKELKTFYQSIITTMRLQQNGNFVSR